MSVGGDFLLALVPVVDALDRLGVAYHLGGSFASSAHGAPRTTLDVDVVADLDERHVSPLVQALDATYYVDGGAARQAVLGQGSFNLIHLETMIKIDVFVGGRGAFDKTERARARRELLEGPEGTRTFPVTSPEDIILRKLRWFKDGRERSERQWRDAIGVLEIQAGRLDVNYLRHWAEVLEVTELLDRALDEATQSPNDISLRDNAKS